MAEDSAAARQRTDSMEPTTATVSEGISDANESSGVALDSSRTTYRSNPLANLQPNPVQPATALDRPAVEGSLISPGSLRRTELQSRQGSADENGTDYFPLADNVEAHLQASTVQGSTQRIVPKRATSDGHLRQPANQSRLRRDSPQHQSGPVLNTGGHALAKTTSNTPLATPGLFQSSATTPIHGLDISDRTPLSSPHLHPVTAPPRTTRSATRDVDFLSGRKLINRYEIMDELGRGVHGKVKLARNLEDGELVAIKIVQRHSKRRRLGKAELVEDKVKKEIAILKKVQHPNVVRLIEVIDDPDISKVYIILEFCQQRELIWRADGLPHIVLLEYYRQEQEANRISAEASNKTMDEIERVAARRRARSLAKNITAIQNARASNYENLWSLEYGGDSDEEEARRTDGRTITIETREEHIVQEPDEMSPISTEEPKLLNLISSRSYPGSQDAGYSFYSTEWYQDAGTSDGLRQRQVSIAESFASQLTERMDEDVPRDFRYVPSMSLSQCREAFRDALLGLEYLHFHGIIHRDIKPENLLRTRDGRVKISDFGVSYLGKPVRDGDSSAEISESESHEVEEEAAFAKTVGTPAFYAPEICTLDVDDELPVIKEQIDIWALGVTLYCLIFAKTPFDAQNEFALMRRIREEEIFIPSQRLLAVDTAFRGGYPTPGQSTREPHDFRHEAIGDDLQDLFKRLFVKNPTQRITIKEIKHHPWILQDLSGFASPSQWIDETDPSRAGHGKIQISNQEVQDAVIPISAILGRIKSISMKATTALGLTGRRSRGTSSATSSEAGSSQALSDIPEQLLQRRSSVQVTSRSIRDKEGDHPLSRSVTASPANSDVAARHDALQEAAPPTYDLRLDNASLRRGSSSEQMIRPVMPERNASEMSTAGSIRTIRASDFRRGSSTTPPLLLQDTAEGPEFASRSPSPRTRYKTSLQTGVRSHDSAAQDPPTAAATESTSASHAQFSEPFSFPHQLHERLEAIAAPSPIAQANMRATPDSDATLSENEAARHLQESSKPYDRDATYRESYKNIASGENLRGLHAERTTKTARLYTGPNGLPCPPSPDDEIEDRMLNMDPKLPTKVSSSKIRSPSDTTNTDEARSRSTSFPSAVSTASIYSSELGKESELNSSPRHHSVAHNARVNALPRIESASDDGYRGEADNRGTGRYATDSSSDEASSDEGDYLTMAPLHRTSTANFRSAGTTGVSTTPVRDPTMRDLPIREARGRTTAASSSSPPSQTTVNDKMNMVGSPNPQSGAATSGNVGEAKEPQPIPLEFDGLARVEEEKDIAREASLLATGDSTSLGKLESSGVYTTGATTKVDASLDDDGEGADDND